MAEVTSIKKFQGLDELYDYKNQCMNDVLKSKEILSLLDASETGLTAKQAMYNMVFPYEYIPETTETAKTFICCEVDIQEVYNKTYLNARMDIFVFTHNSNLRVPSGGLRVDRVVSEIVKILNGSREYGLGQLKLFKVSTFSPIESYQGKHIVFNATDFNLLSPTGKEIPENRKA